MKLDPPLCYQLKYYNGTQFTYTLTVVITSVSVKVHGVLYFGRRLRGHRPTRPIVEVMRSDRFDVHPTLARASGHFPGRVGHAAVDRRRGPARHVHRGADGHANRVRPGPLFCW